MTQELLFSMRKVILDGMRITFLDEKSNSRCWSMTKLWSVPTSFKDKLSDTEKLFIWSLIQAIGSGPCSCFLQSWIFIFQLFLVVCIFRSKLGVDDTALFQRHRQFEETFENAQWRKVNQMQPMWLCHLRTHLKTHGGEKSNKCNQCDYASS